MTKYNVYRTLPTEPSAALDPQSYHLNVIQGKQQGLLKLEERYKKKYKKHTKILDRLVWLNACSSGLSVASEISSVAMLSMFIGLPVSIPLGAVSLAGGRVSGTATALSKKYQKKLARVTKLVDIVALALAVLETSISKALNNGKIDEEELNVLQTLYFKALSELSEVNCKMESENRNQFEKSLREDKSDIKAP